MATKIFQVAIIFFLIIFHKNNIIFEINMS